MSQAYLRYYAAPENWRYNQINLSIDHWARDVAFGRSLAFSPGLSCFCYIRTVIVGCFVKWFV
jgi:hypothetical protein